MEYVAEISGNHQGKKELALELIEKAAWAGATAVKFQLFDPERLAKRRINNPAMKRPDVAGNWDTTTLESLIWLYEQTWTPSEWFPELAAKARSCGIDWFASVFSPEDVVSLAALGCRTMKISAFEWGDEEILGPAMSCTDKLVMSVRGSVPDEEIRRIMDLRKMAVRPKTDQLRPAITLLHATHYRNKYDAMAISRIQKLQKFGVDVGLSDHTTSHIMAADAVVLAKITMIERHIRLEGDITSPDWKFSSTPQEFKEMVNVCNGLDTKS